MFICGFNRRYDLFMSELPVAIVGAGPIGLEMAVGLKRAGVEYLHFDAKQIGYTVSWFAPGTRFFSSNERIAIAGVPLQTVDQDKATREEYLCYLRTVVELFDLKINTYEPVVGIARAREGDGFVLTTRPAGGERTHRVAKVILCTGGTDHPRRLNIPGEDLPHVSHYLADVHTYFRKRVLVVGGRNSAVEAALRIHHAGAKVAISYRRAGFDESSIKYWLLPEIKGLTKHGRIEGHFETVPVRITPTSVVLAHVGVMELTGSSTFQPSPRPSPFHGEGEPGSTTPATEVPADFVLLLVGYEADMALCRMAGVELVGDGQVPRYDQHTMETNVPGVFVAGTAVGGTQEKYRLFIENCHIHVDRIVAALTGRPAPAETRSFEKPES